MAEWLVEEGIGEHRAIRLENGEIAAAEVDWPGGLTVGLVAQVALVSRQAGAGRGTVRFEDGTEALVDRLPKSAAEGASIRVEVVRPSLAESGRTKLARTRPTDAEERQAPSLAHGLELEGHAVRVVRRFPDGDWEALMADAFAGEVAFAGGSLALSPTPAITLIDVDGAAPPRDLALAAVPAVRSALMRLAIRGSVGIDFPTLAEKAHRREVDAALAHELADWPHERTAMNGFGFVQIVSRMQRASILHRATYHRAAAAARLALRRAERVEGAGVIELAVHPALEVHLHERWLEDLRRRTGRPVRIRADAALAIGAPHAQLCQP